jgi:hypothetical protein
MKFLQLNKLKVKYFTSLWYAVVYYNTTHMKQQILKMQLQHYV